VCDTAKVTVSYYRLLIGNHTLAFDWCHFWWPCSTFEGHFSLGCHFHVHFSNPLHAFASHSLPAIAELLVSNWISAILIIMQWIEFFLDLVESNFKSNIKFLPCDAMRCTVLVSVILSICPSVRPSVRLSVRLSVTLVDCVHMVRPTIIISSPYGSPIFLVSGDITLIPKFEGGHPASGRWMRVGWVRIGDFPSISRRISETVRDTTKVTINH